jgi:hypothetical protein
MTNALVVVFSLTDLGRDEIGWLAAPEAFWKSGG